MKFFYVDAGFFISHINDKKFFIKLGGLNFSRDLCYTKNWRNPYGCSIEYCKEGKKAFVEYDECYTMMHLMRIMKHRVEFIQKDKSLLVKVDDYIITFTRNHPKGLTDKICLFDGKKTHYFEL